MHDVQSIDQSIYDANHFCNAGTAPFRHQLSRKMLGIAAYGKPNTSSQTWTRLHCASWHQQYEAHACRTQNVLDNKPDRTAVLLPTHAYRPPRTDAPAMCTPVRVYTTAPRSSSICSRVACNANARIFMMMTSSHAKAYYLDIKNLVNLTSKMIAAQISSKSGDELKDSFIII